MCHLRRKKEKNWLSEGEFENVGCHSEEMSSEEGNTEVVMKSLAQTKRTDSLSWDEYFMASAFLSAMRSKDPHTQVGAVIVNPKTKRIVGVGYNGMPHGCSDDVLPWAKGQPLALDNKYMYVCHAEMNAVLNKNAADVEGCSIYVALFPCNECAKIIIQAGIKEVIYLSDKHGAKPEFKASRRMFALSGVEVRQYVPKMKTITIDFTVLDPDKPFPDLITPKEP